MKLFNRNIIAILAASAGLLTSCSDDVLNRDNGELAGDDGVVIYVPTVPQDVLPMETGTRAGTLTDYTPEEGKIETLRLFAYMDGQEFPVTYDLLSECDPATGLGLANYKGYKLDLDNGNYRMYVVANVTFSNPASIKEADLLKNGVAAPGDLTKGLPMSCTHQDMEVRYDNPGFTPVNNGTIAINSGGNTTIKADLKFAVAKVRITLLNDMRPNEQVGAANVKGHEDKSSVFRDGTYPSVAGSEINIKSKGSYKKFPTIPATGMKDVKVDNMETIESAPTNSKWAWQTVFYVPEQLDQSSRTTTATINLGTTAIPVPVGSKVDGAVDGKKVVERSHFYDFIGSADGKFFLNVQNWNLVSMIGSLNGNTYLDIDKTSLTIEGGEEYEINYKSNAPVTYWSPEYEGQKIYDIKIDETTGKIRVSLNSEIDHQEFNNLYNGEDWKSFKLYAGTIEKHIEVKDIIFRDFITSDTDIVTIDVAVRKQSGDYSSDILVDLRSNLDKFTIEEIEWPASAHDGTPASLRILDKDKNVVADGAELRTDNGKVVLYVSYSDLNSSRELWKDNHDLAIVLKGTDFEGNPITCRVDILIRAAVDTYKIHLYAPDWDHPHIYVYQCLQLPTLPAGTNYTNGGHAGQIVGVHQDAAALEYDFTGAAAFKGWNVGSYNDPNQGGSTQNGFFVFNNDAQSWNPGSTNWTNHYYDMDFCAEQRKEIETRGLCGDCSGSGHKRGWPGIHMLPDDETGDGWWVFELSGVATPGKALIMFTDTPAGHHGYDNNVREDRRYPKKEQPGLALFDYPSKEAWFIYKNTSPLQFYSYNPGGSPSQTYTYRIYWPYAENGNNQWRGLNVWQGGDVWGNKEYTPSNFNNGTIQYGEGGAKYGKYNNGYAYLEFKVVDTPRSGTFKYMRIKTENNYFKEGAQNYYEQEVNFSNFQLIDGVYHYTIKSFANGVGGKPSGDPIPPNPNDPTEGSTTSTFEVGKTYALTFSGSHEVWMWSNSNPSEAITANKCGTDWDHQPKYTGIFDWSPTVAGATQVSYKANKNGNDNNQVNLNVSEFKYNTSTRRYEKSVTL